MDTLYDPAKMAATLIEVETFSPDYFELLKTYPELGKLLTVGPRALVVYQGLAYFVRPAETKPADGRSDTKPGTAVGR